MSRKTSDDAKAWVAKAKDFYTAYGKQIALAEFMNPNGTFVEEELYIFVLDSKGIMLAHGVNDKFAGVEFIHLDDSDGKHFIKEIVSTANARHSGCVEYKWYYPRTLEELPKTVCFEKVDDLIICCGVYKG